MSLKNRNNGNNGNTIQSPAISAVAGHRKNVVNVNNTNNGDDSRSYKLTRYTGNPLDTIAILLVYTIALITALAWQSFSAELFDTYFPETESTVVPRLWYAIIATVLAIILIWIVVKILNRQEAI